jgi:outer membrane protein assembly factor BamC
MSTQFSMTLVFALVGLTACSKIVPKLDEVLPDKRTEYRKSETLPDLEVPPDLTTDAIKDRMGIPEGGQSATFSTYQERRVEQEKQKEIAEAGQAALQKLDNEQLVVVSGSQGLVWPKVRAHFQEQGYSLSLDDAELGVLETGWKENSDELIRDKYKVFAEPGEDPATTVLYVSHVGEKLVPQGEDLVWRLRPTDFALAGQVAAGLRAALAGERTEAAAAPAATVAPAAPAAVASPEEPAAAAKASAPASEAEPASAPAPVEPVPANAAIELVDTGAGKYLLEVKKDFRQTWQYTGEVLKRVGATVEQADSDRGIYYIHWTNNSAPAKKKGMLSKLKFWGGDDDGAYRLSLTGVGDKTELVLLNGEGHWATTESATQLMGHIHRELSKIL